MFNFFKRKPKREFSKEIIKDKTLLNEVAIANISIGSIYPEREEVDLKHIEEMLHDITISTPILSLVRGVCSREINLRSRNGNQDGKIIKDISDRFDNIENWNSFLKELAYTVYYGYTVFEKVYNDDFTLKKIVKIPRSSIKYDWSERKWYLIGTEEIELTEDKFLIATYEDSLEYPKGKSIFNYGLLETYKDYKGLEAKVRGLQARYGDIIPVFGFDESLSTTKEGRDQVKKIAESVKGMVGGNVMAIPMGSNYSLKESFFFISLSDLKIEMHKILLQRLESKIEKFIKGSVFSEGSTGSYNKDSVQQDEKEKIEDEIAMFVGEELLKLVKYDSYLFNYTPQGLFWAFDIDEGEEAREELEKKKAETLAVKIGYLKETKELGYKINKTKIAELIGIEESDLEEVEETTKGFEFSKSKKKIDFYLDKTRADVETLDKYIEESRGKFSKEVFKQALEQLKKKKDIRDLFDGFKFDLTFLEEKLIISALLGNMDEREKELLEFSDDNFNPFSLKFDEAVDSILKRVPALYNDLEPITEEIRAKYTWIKKSTELETTKSLIKNLNKSLEEGKTYKEWIKNSESILKTTGFGENGWYLNLVWRNNIHSAYNAGAFHRQEENKDNKPYGLYDSIEDGRETEICKSLDGKVYRLDHEFWNTFMPPNHHGCRSRRIAVSKEDLKEYGLKISKIIPESIEGIKEKMGDFVGNPVRLEKNLQKIIASKEKKIEKMYKKAIQLDFASIKDEKYKELYKNIFKDVSEDILKTIKPLIGEFDVQGTRKISCYKPGIWLVELENESQITALHEFGHFIDNVMAWKSKKVEAVSRFSSHVSYDLFNPTSLQKVVDKTMKSFMRTAKNKARPLEIKKYILENFTKEELYKREFAGIQDILNGLTKGKVGIYYGHSKEYWKRPGAPHHESFANMFQLYSTRETMESKKCIEVMEKFLPDIWNEFKKVITEGA